MCTGNKISYLAFDVGAPTILFAFVASSGFRTLQVFGRLVLPFMLRYRCRMLFANFQSIIYQQYSCDYLLSNTGW